MKTRQKPQLDEKVERRLDKLMGPKPEILSERDWRSAKEQMRLCMLYRGEYVVYRDHITGRGRNTRLALREVIGHSPDLDEVQKYFKGLSQEELQLYHLSYVDED